MVGIYTLPHKPDVLVLGEASPAANTLKLGLFAAGDAIVALPVYLKEIMEYLNKDAAKTKPLKLARKLMLSLRTRESYGRSRNLSQIYAVDPPIAGKEYVHPSGLFRFSYREEELRLTLHSSEWPYPNEYLLFRITRREEIGVLTSRKAVNFMTEESNTKFAIRFAAPIMSISRATGISPPQLLIREPGLLYLLMRFIGR